MTPLPENTPARIGHDRLAEIAAELQQLTNNNDPISLAHAERNHWARMWDEAVHEILHNMQGIRQENRALRDKLNDLERGQNSVVLAAIREAKEEILEEIKASTASINARVREAKKGGLFSK